MIVYDEKQKGYYRMSDDKSKLERLNEEHYNFEIDLQTGYYVATVREDIMSKSDSQAILEETFKEYSRVSVIFGSESTEALAAKNAYLEAYNGSSVKSRYELEGEIADTSKKINEAIDNYTLELIEKGRL